MPTGQSSPTDTVAMSSRGNIYWTRAWGKAARDGRRRRQCQIHSLIANSNYNYTYNSNSNYIANSPPIFFDEPFLGGRVFNWQTEIIQIWNKKSRKKPTNIFFRCLKLGGPSYTPVTPLVVRVNKDLEWGRCGQDIFHRMDRRDDCISGWDFGHQQQTDGPLGRRRNQNNQLRVFLVCQNHSGTSFTPVYWMSGRFPRHGPAGWLHFPVEILVENQQQKNGGKSNFGGKSTSRFW